jgi:hypothetical protein
MATLREDLMDCITRFTDRKNKTSDDSGRRGDYASAMRDEAQAQGAQSLAVLLGSVLAKHGQ